LEKAFGPSASRKYEANRLKVTARSHTPARPAANTTYGAFVGIYTIGPDPRHFASSRAAITERNMRGNT
jgi:hypothetical protein